VRPGERGQRRGAGPAERPDPAAGAWIGDRGHARGPLARLRGVVDEHDAPCPRLVGAQRLEQVTGALGFGVRRPDRDCDDELAHGAGG
jgi:hypothetical protein